VRLLGLCRHPEAAALLAQAGADDDLVGLVEAALRHRGAPAAGHLLAALPDTPPRALPVLLPVLVDLAVGGPDEAGVAERLGALLGEEDDLVAAAAAEGLGALGRPEAIGPLVGRIGSGTPRLVRAAGQALARLGGRWPAEVRQALSPIELEGGSAPVLATLLGTVGTADDVPRLRTALGSDQVALRRAAVEALARLGGEAAADAVILALADESTDVQVAAAVALGRIGGPRAAAALRPTLASAAPAVVAAAAGALGELGGEESIAPLRELAASAHGAVASGALDALGRLGERGQSSALDEPTLEAALLHADAEVVKKGLRWAGRDRGRPSLDRLVRALGHDAWDVRHLAARLLGGLGSAAAREALARRREAETDALVLAAIAEALDG